MKKLLLSLTILPLFLFIASPSYAEYFGTFTASNYCYNPTTHELKFEISDMDPAPISDQTIVTITVADPSYVPDYTYNSSLSLPYTTTSIDNFTNTFNSDVPNDSTNVMLGVFYYNPVLDEIGRYKSQNIQGSDLLSAPGCDSNEVKIVADPESGSKTVGTPFNVDVKVTDDGEAFNAARATVSVSSNLAITGIHNATSDSCNLQYTQQPTASNPSFAGAIYGGSSTGCTVYTLTLTPTDEGTGTITFTNGSIKAYSDSSEILTGVQNASFSISDGPTPTPTPELGFTITNVLQTYHSSFNLTGTKLEALTHIFVNGSDDDSTYPTDTTWENSQSLSLGDNNFTIYGSDDEDNQTATQTVTVDRHTLGDINGDGNVDLIDASLFAVDWDKTEDLAYILSDMNDDGNVDLTDLSILAKLIE